MNVEKMKGTMSSSVQNGDVRTTRCDLNTAKTHARDAARGVLKDS